MIAMIRDREDLIYPESDGQPMGENTLQVKWIIELFNGLQAVYRDRQDVFIAADLFWYPVLGEPKTVLAPDIMVAFGRPKGDRPSYKQWREENIPPQVVFEILSPGNKKPERDKKLKFYQLHGVEEYYEYNPNKHILKVWLRSDQELVPVKDVNGFVSPRMGLKFEVTKSEPMTVFDPDGEPFRSYLDLLTDAENEQERTFKERKRADSEAHRAAVLAAKLRELGVDPDRI